MNDYLGKPLEVGDTVVFITPGYRDFSKGIITGFSKCYVYIDKIPKKDPWDTIKQFPNQLIKVDEI